MGVLMQSRLNVAIIGTGNIGTDLLYKIARAPLLNCIAFVGRNSSSQGIAVAQQQNIVTSTEGIHFLLKYASEYDLVFDATNANDHLLHGPQLNSLGKFVVNLTPAKLGELVCPIVNINKVNEFNNVNMITCGGQAAIPLAYALGKTQTNIEYIEVVSSIASKSAGPATRRNMDEYIETTEEALRKFSGCSHTKAILILNPAEPCIDMQTTVSAKLENPDLVKLDVFLKDIVKRVQEYIPGYKLIVPPIYENGRIMMMVRVKGRGDYLPTYAGNLDIINCAAIMVAEAYVKSQSKENQGLLISTTKKIVNK